MINSYSLLFDIQVTHTYFETGFCEGLIYSPSVATKQLIDRFAIKLMTTNKGVQLYSSNNQTIEDFLNYIQRATEVSYFEFNVQTIDRAFYQYTALPIDKIVELSFNSKEFDKENNSIVLKQQFTESTQSTNLFTLKIHFVDLINASVNNSGANYRIDFFARKTKWQYNIINNSQQDFEQLSIKGDAGVEFNSGKAVVLDNGQAAIAFTSINNDIQFSQLPKYSFDLINIEKRLGVIKGKTVFKGLPMPNPSQLQVINSNNENLVVSPMYVYI